MHDDEMRCRDINTEFNIVYKGRVVERTSSDTVGMSISDTHHINNVLRTITITHENTPEDIASRCATTIYEHRWFGIDSFEKMKQQERLLLRGAAALRSTLSWFEEFREFDHRGLPSNFNSHTQGPRITENDDDLFVALEGCLSALQLSISKISPYTNPGAKRKTIRDSFIYDCIAIYESATGKCANSSRNNGSFRDFASAMYAMLIDVKPPGHQRFNIDENMKSALATRRRGHG